LDGFSLSSHSGLAGEGVLMLVEGFKVDRMRIWRGMKPPAGYLEALKVNESKKQK
jgi:hypothetical protein